MYTNYDKIAITVSDFTQQAFRKPMVFRIQTREAWRKDVGMIAKDGADSINGTGSSTVPASVIASVSRLQHWSNLQLGLVIPIIHSRVNYRIPAIYSSWYLQENAFFAIRLSIDCTSPPFDIFYPARNTALSKLCNGESGLSQSPY